MYIITAGDENTLQLGKLCEGGRTQLGLYREKNTPLSRRVFITIHAIRSLLVFRSFLVGIKRITRLLHDQFHFIGYPSIDVTKRRNPTPTETTTQSGEENGQHIKPYPIKPVFMETMPSGEHKIHGTRSHPTRIIRRRTDNDFWQTIAINVLVSSQRGTKPAKGWERNIHAFVSPSG